MTGSIKSGISWLASGVQRLARSGAGRAAMGLAKKVLLTPQEASGQLLSAATGAVAAAGLNYAVSFMNGANMRISQDSNGGVVIEAQGAPERDGVQEAENQIVSRRRQVAKDTLKFTMSLATFAAMVHNKQRMGSIPRELAALFRQQDLSQFVTGLRSVVPTPQALIAGVQGSAQTAMVTASSARGLVHAFGPDVVAAARSQVTHVARCVGAAVAQYVPLPAQRVVSTVASGVQRGVGIGANMAMRVIRPLGGFVVAHPRIAGAAAGVSVIAGAYRSYRSRQQALERAPYELSDDAQVIRDHAFGHDVIQVQAADSSGARFAKNYRNGSVVSKSDINRQLEATRSKLGALLSPSYKARLEANIDLGFSVNFKERTLVLVLPKTPGLDDFIRYEYDLDDDTSIAEFIEKFGRDADVATGVEAVSINEVKAFLQGEVGVYKPKSSGTISAGSIGQCELTSEQMHALFNAQASMPLTPLTANEYKEEVLLDHQTKLDFMRDYYTLTVRSMTAGEPQKEKAQEKLDLLSKINAKRMLEMELFLKHNMPVKVRRIDRGWVSSQVRYEDQELSIKEVVEQVSQGSLPAEDLGVALSSLVDYAKKLDGASSKSVSELVNLFISIVSIKLKGQNSGRAMSEAMERGLYSLRKMQRRLIRSKELVKVSHSKAISDLEALITSSSYNKLEQYIESGEGAVISRARYNEAMRARIRGGDSAEGQISERTQTLLGRVGIKLRGGRAPARLAREIDTFAKLFHAFNPQEVTGTPSGEVRALDGWATLQHSAG